MEPKILHDDERVASFRSRLLRYISRTSPAKLFETRSKFSDFSCEDGKLTIIVSVGGRKEGFVCDRAGQNVTLSLVDGGYLHEGSIVCPACSEVCKQCNNEGENKPGKKIGVDDKLDCGFGGVISFIRDTTIGNKQATGSTVGTDNKSSSSSTTTSSSTSSSSSSVGDNILPGGSEATKDTIAGNMLRNFLNTFGINL